MNRVTILTLTIIVLIMLHGDAVSLAQVPGPPRAPGMPVMPVPRGNTGGMVATHPALILLGEKRIQKELGLVEAQIRKLDEIRVRSGPPFDFNDDK